MLPQLRRRHGIASGVTAIRNGNQTFGAVPATGCGTGLTISLSRIVLVWRAAATPTPRAIPAAVREVPLSWHRPALAYSVEKFLLPDRDRGLFPDGYSVNDSPRDRHARATQGDQHGPILPIGWPHAPGISTTSDKGRAPTSVEQWRKGRSAKPRRRERSTESQAAATRSWPRDTDVSRIDACACYLNPYNPHALSRNTVECSAFVNRTGNAVRGSS